MAADAGRAPARGRRSAGHAGDDAGDARAALADPEPPRCGRPPSGRWSASAPSRPRISRPRSPIRRRGGAAAGLRGGRAACPATEPPSLLAGARRRRRRRVAEVAAWASGEREPAGAGRRRRARGAGRRITRTRSCGRRPWPPSGPSATPAGLPAILAALGRQGHRAPPGGARARPLRGRRRRRGPGARPRATATGRCARPPRTSAS